VKAGAPGMRVGEIDGGHGGSFAQGFSSQNGRLPLVFHAGWRGVREPRACLSLRNRETFPARTAAQPRLPRPACL
jgi:hypothetical protein